MVQAVAFVLVHVSVVGWAPEDGLAVIVVGLAESVTVGAGVETVVFVTVIVTEAGALVPPWPVHVTDKLYVPAVFALNDIVPAVAGNKTLPNPDGVQAVALVAFHVTLVSAPTAIVVAAAERVTVGAGVVMVGENDREVITAESIYGPRPCDNFIVIARRY